MRYELLEHTADVLIKAYGRDLEECFANAAYALFDQMVDVSEVRPEVEMDLEVEGHDLESLLYNFLSEFLYLRDARQLVFSEFQVRFDGLRLRCRCKGERFDHSRHRPGHEVKAITYHMLSVHPEEPSVTVIFDI
ncbi:MAG: archease [Methanomassiliicoccales archaeon]|jgi:SHS2 domain-containing protein|nr:archease [Methanomassiliicoccales archaeon]